MEVCLVHPGEGRFVWCNEVVVGDESVAGGDDAKINHVPLIRTCGAELSYPAHQPLVLLTGVKSSGWSQHLRQFALTRGYVLGALLKVLQGQLSFVFNRLLTGTRGDHKNPHLRLRS